MPKIACSTIISNIKRGIPILQHEEIQQAYKVSIPCAKIPIQVLLNQNLCFPKGQILLRYNLHTLKVKDL